MFVGDGAVGGVGGGVVIAVVIAVGCGVVAVCGGVGRSGMLLLLVLVKLLIAVAVDRNTKVGILRSMSPSSLACFLAGVRACWLPFIATKSSTFSSVPIE